MAEQVVLALCETKSSVTGALNGFGSGLSEFTKWAKLGGIIDSGVCSFRTLDWFTYKTYSTLGVMTDLFRILLFFHSRKMTATIVVKW